MRLFRFSVPKTFLICLLFCGLCLSLFAGCGPAEPAQNSEGGETMPESSVESAEPSEPEEDRPVVFRMAVASDVHMSSASDETAGRLRKLFSSAYAYAESQDYAKLDAAVFVGDVTNYGQASEWNAFLSVSEQVRRDETVQIAVMGNHEYYNGKKAVYTSVVNPETNIHKVVNGFHLIALSPDGDNEYNADTLAFLKEALEEAAKDEPDKPIFVFQHHHIRNTVYVSAEWSADDSAKLDAILKNYPQVIDFSGHSHAPINHPTSIYQKDYTCVGTGTLAYFELLSGMTGGTIPSDAGQAAQYWIVEVADNGKTTLLPYNILTDDFFRTASTLDGDAQLIYTVSPSAGKEGFKYTLEQRKAASDKPFFPSGSELILSDVYEQGVTLTFPQAGDGDCIYSYRAECVSADGQKVVFARYAPFYIEPLADTVACDVSGCKPGTDYTVSVYPVDCYGNEGEPLTGSFRTDDAKQSVYVTSVPVRFEGTCANFDHLTELTQSDRTPAYGGAPNGDVFAGDWASAAKSTGGRAQLKESGGYLDSPCLEVWALLNQNQGLYLFPNERNQFSTQFKDPQYLRVWADFTDVEFRKANFGLVAPGNCLYTTDEKDYTPNLYFWYLPEGGTEWIRCKHGEDGCFGTEQGSSVHGLKGWFAFPLSDFGYRTGTGSGSPRVTGSFPGSEIAGIYLFWDYDKTVPGQYDQKTFRLDEFQLVNDYTVFEEYKGENG